MEAAGSRASVVTEAEEEQEEGEELTPPPGRLQTATFVKGRSVCSYYK